MTTFNSHRSVAAFMLAMAVQLVGASGQTPASPSEVRFSGRTLFENYCATCHGAGAVGNGPLSALLRKPPANLTLLAEKNGGTFSREMVARIIDGRKPLSGHGGGDMPVWGDAFDRSSDGASTTQAKIAALAAFIESIQKKP
jgi:mono/diheme cytochrome c family protein